MTLKIKHIQDLQNSIQMESLQHRKSKLPWNLLIILKNHNNESQNAIK